MGSDKAEVLLIAGVSVAGIIAGVSAGAALHRLLGGPADCTQVEADGGVVAGVRYVERMRGGADPNEAVPMVVLFHSLGATPEGHAAMLTNIGRARLILPEGEYESESGSGRKWWQRGVKDAVENDPEGAAVQWEAASDRMAEFLRQIVQCRPTIGKPILTGSSQGGEMTLLMASTYPRLAGSGVAVSSYLLEPFWTARMAPTAMLHGTGDTTVPYAWARDYAEVMQAKGAPLGFESYESAGHAVTKPMSRAWIGLVGSEVERTWGVLAA